MGVPRCETRATEEPRQGVRDNKRETVIDL